jgi:predicted DNA binding CopG/RHH family protein
MVTKSNDIRIRNISDDRYTTIKSIAAYFGIPVGTFVRQELVKIIEQYPENVKKFLPLND